MPRRDLKSLLEYYDCFGWVPTVGGALALDLMGDKSGLFGDVDRHAVVVKNYNGLSSERFIAATSLLTVNDRKHGSDYGRTFRYFFVGSIHNQERLEAFKRNAKIEVDSELDRLLEKDGALIGELIIVVEESHTLSDTEVSILRKISDLEAKKGDYKTAFSIDAASLADLQAKRTDMKHMWEELEGMAKRLTAQDRPTFCFEVFLTRDGILLLKDNTLPKCKGAYFKENEASDYTKNIPLHRLFKSAMNYIKYLFHYNYHHNCSHDTYLPASNLHPATQGQNRDFSGIFRHQMDAFLQPVIRLKRQGFREFYFDPVGIIAYSKSFVATCANNGLIDKDRKDRTLEYIGIQESEINHLTRHHRTQLSAIISQRHFILMFSAIVALTAAVVKIASTVVKIPQYNFSKSFAEQSSALTAALIVIAVIIAIAIALQVTHARVLKKEYRRNTSPGWLRRNLMVDSNLDNKSFSWRYRAYIYAGNFLLWIGKKGAEWAKLSIYLLLFAAAIVAIVLLLP